jgi:hypothetical protein
MKTFSFGQLDSVLIKGVLIDAISKQPIQNYELVLSSNFGTQVQTTKTDNCGRFQIKTVNKKYYLELKNPHYIDKSFFLTGTKQTLNLEIALRPRNQGITYLNIDSTLIHSTIKSIAKKFTLDFSDLNQINEPTGIIRGFHFELGDSTIIYLFIERTVYLKQSKSKLFKKRIIGLAISRNNGVTTYYGDGKPYIMKLHNKYFVANQSEN